MYIPILKNRQQELKIIKNFQKCFSERITPMIELIGDYKGTTENTLYDLQERLRGKQAFVDFFAFDKDVYKNIDLIKCNLALEVRTLDKYMDKLSILKQYQNIIPVISISNARNFKNENLKRTLLALKKEHKRISVRITDNYLYEYIEDIEKVLDERDFFMLDIKQQDIESKLMENMKTKDSDLKARKLILNSPRHREYQNGTYKEDGWTSLIDNCVAVKYKEEGYEGYGDYVGLKDALPSKSGRGLGAALALVYLYNNNKFYVSINQNTKDGVSGFKNVIKRLSKLPDSEFEKKDCPMFNLLYKMIKEGKSGNWASWIYLTMARYIDQVYRHYLL